MTMKSRACLPARYALSPVLAVAGDSAKWPRTKNADAPQVGFAGISPQVDRGIYVMNIMCATIELRWIVTSSCTMQR